MPKDTRPTAVPSVLNGSPIFHALRLWWLRERRERWRWPAASFSGPTTPPQVWTTNPHQYQLLLHPCDHTSVQRLEFVIRNTHLEERGILFPCHYNGDRHYFSANLSSLRQHLAREFHTILPICQQTLFALVCNGNELFPRCSTYKVSARLAMYPALK